MLHYSILCCGVNGGDITGSLSSSTPSATVRETCGSSDSTCAENCSALEHTINKVHRSCRARFHTYGMSFFHVRKAVSPCIQLLLYFQTQAICNAHTSNMQSWAHTPLTERIIGPHPTYRAHNRKSTYRAHNSVCTHHTHTIMRSVSGFHPSNSNRLVFVLIWEIHPNNGVFPHLFTHSRFHRNVFGL